MSRGTHAGIKRHCKTSVICCQLITRALWDHTLCISPHTPQPVLKIISKLLDWDRDTALLLGQTHHNAAALELHPTLLQSYRSTSTSFYLRNTPSIKEWKNNTKGLSTQSKKQISPTRGRRVHSKSALKPPSWLLCQEVSMSFLHRQSQSDWWGIHGA